MSCEAVRAAPAAPAYGRDPARTPVRSDGRRNTVGNLL